MQCGQQETHSIYVDILSQLLSEACYTQLRTKEQLGYIVLCGTRKANGVCGLRIIVQSERHPAYVETRIEHFLNNMVVCFSFKISCTASNVHVTGYSFLVCVFRITWKT